MGILHVIFYGMMVYSIVLFSINVEIFLRVVLYVLTTYPLIRILSMLIVAYMVSKKLHMNNLNVLMNN